MTSIQVNKYLLLFYLLRDREREFRDIIQIEKDKYINLKQRAKKKTQYLHYSSQPLPSGIMLTLQTFLNITPGLIQQFHY